MAAEKKLVEMDLGEWAGLFANKEDCAGFCRNILQSLYNDTVGYTKKVQEYFDERPEVMAVSGVKVKLSMEALGRKWFIMKMELRQKGNEEKGG